MNPLLRIRGLRSGYAGGVVLGGVDLDLDEGGTVALLGRNGVGKTTLISTVMGLVRPYEGSVGLDGRDLAGARVDVIARAGVGVVPQGRRVFAPLTVDEHLTIASRRPAHGPGPGPESSTCCRAWGSASDTAETSSPEENSRCSR